MRPFWKKMLSCAMAFVCLTGAAAGLTGCHGSKEKAAFEVPESFDTTKQYEITFWAKNDTNIRQTDIYKKTIADFEALYPNITVNLKLYTDYGKIYNDVITNIATQTTPSRFHGLLDLSSCCRSHAATALVCVFSAHLRFHCKETQ